MYRFRGPIAASVVAASAVIVCHLIFWAWNLSLHLEIPRPRLHTALRFVLVMHPGYAMAIQLLCQRTLYRANLKCVCSAAEVTSKSRM